MKLMKTRWIEFVEWLTRDEPPPPPPDTKALVHRFDLTIDASCPCGSKYTHPLTLMSTVDCPRCDRVFGITSIRFQRTRPASYPQPIVTIGYVEPGESLARVRTRRVAT